MRAHVVGRHIAPEMLALWVVELVLTFALALILLTPSSGNFTLASVNPAVTCALTVGFIAFTIGLYRPQMFGKVRNLLFSTMLAAVLSFPAVWLVSKLLGLSTYWPVGYDSLRPIKIIAVWSAGVLCTRLLFLFATRCNLFVHRVAVIGPETSPSVASAVHAGRKGFLEISVMRPERASALSLDAARIRTLVFSAGNEQDLLPAISEEYRRHGITVQNEADFWERHLRRVDIANLDSQWFEDIETVSVGKASLRLGRAFDVMLSVVLLLVTLPIICIVALLVRMDSSGPILYRQERVGLNNKPFTVLKFRSMAVDAEAAGPRWAQQKDPRVTRVGSFMRKTRIDELPQLANILRGEMSFIGPRPERPHFVEQLSQVIPCYHERSRVKPGLTGWAQVNYPYGASVEDARAKLSYDLYYVKNRSMFLDLLILLSTVRVILLQEGAR